MAWRSWFRSFARCLDRATSLVCLGYLLLPWPGSRGRRPLLSPDGGWLKGVCRRGIIGDQFPIFPVPICVRIEDPGIVSLSTLGLDCYRHCAGRDVSRTALNGGCSVRATYCDTAPSGQLYDDCMLPPTDVERMLHRLPSVSSRETAVSLFLGGHGVAWYLPRTIRSSQVSVSLLIRGTMYLKWTWMSWTKRRASLELPVPS